MPPYFRYKSHYVNQHQDSNSFRFKHVMKTEVSDRPASTPRPQDVGVSWFWAHPEQSPEAAP